LKIKLPCKIYNFFAFDDDYYFLMFSLTFQQRKWCQEVIAQLIFVHFHYWSTLVRVWVVQLHLKELHTKRAKHEKIIIIESECSLIIHFSHQIFRTASSIDLRLREAMDINCVTEPLWCQKHRNEVRKKNQLQIAFDDLYLTRVVEFERRRAKFHWWNTVGIKLKMFWLLDIYYNSTLCWMAMWESKQQHKSQ
jgi:hypothetical protein